MHYADIQMTMQICTQSVDWEKREADKKMVS